MAIIIFAITLRYTHAAAMMLPLPCRLPLPQRTYDCHHCRYAADAAAIAPLLRYAFFATYAVIMTAPYRQRRAFL